MLLNQLLKIYAERYLIPEGCCFNQVAEITAVNKGCIYIHQIVEQGKLNASGI